MYYVDGIVIRNWFISGMREIEISRKHLNSINVFPVADGDTGDNLATTIRAMVEKTVFEKYFGKMLNDISSVGLRHARGNSGIIFASYFKGLANKCKNLEMITHQEFARLAKDAVAHLYEIIENPVEGTMISVINDWANFLHSNSDKYLNIEEMMSAAYKCALSSLESTKDKLEVLRKHNVVDSGAEGFVKFLKGIDNFMNAEKKDSSKLNSETENDETENDDADKTKSFDDSNDTITYRFCTEVLLEINDFSPSLESDIKEALKGLGDSLIVSLFEKSLRVHIHTNNPNKVVFLLKKYGKISEQKIEDMLFQNNINKNKLYNTAILTDSIADITDKFVLENQIHVLPLSLIIEEVSYIDKQSVKLSDLFAEINSGVEYPKSSLPSPSIIEDMLIKILERYEKVLIVTVSGKLSGTLNTINMVLRMLKEDKPELFLGKSIEVVDSRLNSGAEALIVYEANERLKEGMEISDISKELEQIISKTKIYVCLETLDNAVKGGRVPAKIGKIGNMLGARPIMTLDAEGNGTAFGISFSKKGITKKIFGLMKRINKEKGIKNYTIVHADNLSLAEEYREFMVSLTGKEPVFLTEISAVTAIHSGEGCVAISFTTEE